MALAAFAKNTVAALGLRCGTPLLADSGATLRSLAARGYATGER